MSTCVRADLHYSTQSQAECKFQDHTLPAPPTEMASLREIKQRLAVIEQGQGVICERLDALKLFFEEEALALKKGSSKFSIAVGEKLDAILVSQPAKPKPQRKKERK